MSNLSILEAMIVKVKTALGNELMSDVAFVGGCTTSLMITDPVSREHIRMTQDVDLIVNVLNKGKWAVFEQQLIDKGFTVSMEDNYACRRRLGELIVDFLPDNSDILGFSNRWYSDALKNAQAFTLSSGEEIPAIRPEYFIATKLEAYRGRGEDDPLSSKDMEDILDVLDGRESLIEEILSAPKPLQQFIAEEFQKLLTDSSFEYAVQSAADGNAEREALLFERIELLIQNAEQ